MRERFAIRSATSPPPSRVRSGCIAIAAEPITDVDTTAADMLADLDEKRTPTDLLVFAELKSRPDKLERYRLIGPLDPPHFFPTLDAAVDAFRQRTGGEWTSTAETSA